MVHVCSEVDIWEFEHNEVLREALNIITLLREKRARGEKIPAGEERLMENIAHALGVFIPNGRDIPPPSTAASIHTIEELRAWKGSAA